jgi:predicted RNase H-like HicB family nuclease
MTPPMQRLKLIVERHQDGYVAYPLGVEGIVVGQGDTYEEAVADLRSAITFHVETFGPGVLEQADPVEEVFVAEAVVPA